MGEPLQWRNVALEQGLLLKHTHRSEGISGLHESLGAGVCALDFDNDGWQDLFFVGGQGQTRNYGKDSWWNKKQGHRLYRNSGNGFFVDESARLKEVPLHNGMGCHAADLDGDNDIDMVVSGFRESFILHNQNGTFTALPLPTASVWTTGIAITDVDGNGLPDIYLTGYLAYNHTAKVLETQSGFMTGELLAFKAASFKGERNFLLLNKGKLEFTENAEAFDALQPETRSLFVSTLDANDDAWPDLFIANDNGSQSELLINQAGKGFSLSADSYPLPKNALSMLALADTTNHQTLWFNTQASQLPVWLKPYQNQWQDRIWRATDNHNVLANFNSFASAAVDVNHDGEPDLILANGLPTPDEDSHARSRGQFNAVLISEQGRFSAPVLLPEAQSSRSVIGIDIDNDGDRDSVITNNNAMPELYITPAAPENWLGLAFGSRVSTDVHAVTVVTSQRTLFRPLQANTFLGSHDPRFQQSLKPGESVISVKIHHYHGDDTTLDKPALGTYLDTTGKPVQAAQTPTTPLPYPLARWQLIAGKLAPSVALHSLNLWSSSEQLDFLDDLLQHDIRHDYLGTVISATYSAETQVVLQAIVVLQTWEDELSANRLLHLLEHTDAEVRCRTAEAYRYFYQEEESMVESKRLAMSKLIKNAGDRLDTCAIAALGFTRDARPAFALNPLLTATDKPEILHAVLQALGELRHHTSASAIEKSLPQLPITVKKEAELTLHRIKGDIHALGLQPVANNPACTVKNTLAGLAEQCDENTLLGLLQQQPVLAKAFEQQLLTLNLHPAKKAGLLTGLQGSNAATLMMQFVNNKQNPESLCIAALSILAYLPMPKAYLDNIQGRFADKTLSKPLRIALGDILIHNRADWLLNHTEGLF